MAQQAPLASPRDSVPDTEYLECYLVSCWKWKPAGVERVLNGLRAKFGDAEFMYETRFNWFKVICDDKDICEVEKRFKSIQDDIVDGILTAASYHEMLDADGNFIEEKFESDFIGPWKDPVERTHFTAQQEFENKKYTLPQVYAVFPYCDLWTELENGSDNLTIHDLMDEDLRLSWHKELDVLISYDCAGQVVYLGGETEADVEDIKARLDVLLTARRFDHPKDHPNYPYQEKMGTSAAMHALNVESYVDKILHEFTTDARFMANIDLNLLSSTLLDKNLYEDLPSEYKKLARAVTLRLCRYDVDKKYHTSFIGPKVKNGRVRPGEVLKVGKRRFQLYPRRLVVKAYMGDGGRRSWVPALAILKAAAEKKNQADEQEAQKLSEDNEPQMALLPATHIAQAPMLGFTEDMDTLEHEKSVEIQTWVDRVQDKRDNLPVNPPLMIGDLPLTLTQGPASLLPPRGNGLNAPLSMQHTAVNSTNSIIADEMAAITDMLKMIHNKQQPSDTDNAVMEMLVGKLQALTAEVHKIESTSQHKHKLAQECVKGSSTIENAKHHLPTTPAPPMEQSLGGNEHISNGPRQVQQPIRGTQLVQDSKSMDNTPKTPLDLLSGDFHCNVPLLQPQTSDGVSMATTSEMTMATPNSSLHLNDEPLVLGDGPVKLGQGRNIVPAFQAAKSPRKVLSTPTHPSHNRVPTPSPFILLPDGSNTWAYDASRQEIIKQTTMRQKTGNRPVAGDSEDPAQQEYSQSFIENLVDKTKALLSQGQHLAGKINLRVEFGRILLQGLDDTALAFNAAGTPSNGWDMKDLQNRLQEVDRWTTFTKILTQDGDDIEQMVTARDARKNKKLWQKATKSAIHPTYSFVFVNVTKNDDGKMVEGDEFILDIDGVNWSYALRTNKNDFEPVWVHSLLRRWDMRIVMTYNSKAAELEAKHGEFARSLIANLQCYFPAEHRNDARLKFGMHNSFHVKLKGVRALTRFRHTGLIDNSFLDVTEVVEYGIHPCAGSPGIPDRENWDLRMAEPVRGSNRKEMEAAGKPCRWYEASVSSSRIEDALAKNKKLAKGKKANWDPEALATSHPRDDAPGGALFFELIRPALRVLKEMDSVGTNSDNQQTENMQLPRPNDPEVPGTGSRAGPSSGRPTSGQFW